MSDREKEYIGDVVREPFATGTKSARPAVILRTRYGDFVLRRSGSHPLVDPELDPLVGKRLRVRGVIHRHTLTLSEWEEIGGE